MIVDLKNYIYSITGLSILALYLSKEIKKINQISVSILSVKPNFAESVTYTFFKLPIDILLEIDNITFFEQTINSIFLKVHLNNIYLGNVEKNLPFKIIASKKSKVQVTVMLNLIEIGFNYKQIYNLFFTKDIKIKVEGKINTSLGKIPIFKEFSEF